MILPDSIQHLIHYATVDYEKDKDIIITTVFNRGSIEDIRWVLKNYKREDLLRNLSHPLRGEWDPKSLNFFANYFKVNLADEIKRQSIKSISLTY